MSVNVGWFFIAAAIFLFGVAAGILIRSCGTDEFWKS